MRASPLLVLVLAPALVTACSDGGSPTQPTPVAASGARGRDDARTLALTRFVEMTDACDPATFGALCARPGMKHVVTFPQFIAQVRQLHVAPLWRFAPASLTIALGSTLKALNLGGEVHTFTEVATFGGGIVPLLNELSQNRAVAPECLTLAPSDFIPPGGSTTDTPSSPGVERYQCCIHPWMRTTVTITATH